ncbi:unnamed protein product [Auanema sp. JU1783]|nr:unnamed protein product [Auanema sp. JU1783]
MSLFTVEQLELIRRLRTTGITAQQVVEAFEQMEQMDTDLSKPSVCDNGILLSGMQASPESDSAADDSISSPVLLQHLKAQAPVPVTISASNPTTCSSPERISVQTVPPASSAEQQQQQQHLNLQLAQLQNGVDFKREMCNSMSASSPVQPLSSPLAGSSLSSTPCSASSMLFMPKFENHSGGRPIRKLVEFMEQGEEGCISDMKQFINQYSLRQTTVAMMTGVSQPYISKLLNGNHRELSLRCRKNIYCWYLNCRKHPEKLAAFLSDPATRLETNGDGELIPQRRERYVFRPVLIKMLETFFSHTPFPDLNKRIEIATTCNHALQLDKKGVGLMPKEVVSPQVVANWFANKRKELRRRSQENQENKPHMMGSLGLSAQSSTPLHDEGSSGCASTPSPSIEDTNMSEISNERTLSDVLGLNNSQPFDMMTLVSRLGLQLPGMQSAMLSSPTRSVSPEMSPTVLPVNAATSTTPSTSASSIPKGDIETIATHLLSNQQVSLATSLAMLHPTLSMLSNETSKAQFDLGNLAMAYDQLRSPLIKLEQPVFKLEQRIE